MVGSLLYRVLGFLRGMPEGAASNLEAIEKHLAAVLGECTQVLHERYSPDELHIDILHFGPNGDRDFHYLVTSGVSDRPLTNAGEDITDPLVELCIALPERWEVSAEGFKKPGMYEPIGLLKMLARYPHRNQTFFTRGHTLPLGAPAYTPMTAVLLMGPVLMPGLAEPLKLGGGREIQFLAPYLLHEEELSYKLDGGLDGLLERFAENGITEEYDLSRSSVFRSA